jgi:hypothetical protein
MTRSSDSHGPEPGKPARRRRRKRLTMAKKAKKVDAPPPPPKYSRDLWEVREILDEERDARGLWYLVDWTGTDPATGAPWEPDWIRADGVYADVCLDKWKIEKQRRRFNRLHPRGSIYAI